MALYAALLYYGEDGGWMAREHLAEQSGFLADPAAGEVVRGWQALCRASTATTITVGGGLGGDVVITDGSVTPQLPRGGAPAPQESVPGCRRSRRSGYM